MLCRRVESLEYGLDWAVDAEKLLERRPYHRRKNGMPTDRTATPYESAAVTATLRSRRRSSWWGSEPGAVDDGSPRRCPQCPATDPRKGSAEALLGASAPSSTERQHVVSVIAVPTESGEAFVGCGCRPVADCARAG